MAIIDTFSNVMETLPLVKDASASGNLQVLRSLLGPAFRGMVQKRGKNESMSAMPVDYSVRFDWHYLRDKAELTRLYEAAKTSQWNGTTDLDWTTNVDPLSDETALLPWEFLPVANLASFKQASLKERAEQRRAITAWLLSQSLHGEQGALFAACQVTEAVPWLDGKLYGSTQVVDEGRHVEVFHAYLTKKLEKKYEINDNLYVVIDALMSDSRWDMKFLGMQIMIEGLALGTFGMIQQLSREPLLKKMLTYIITDEARHVHYGVLALKDFIVQLTEKERREREDWAFEVSLFLRNRFFAHEFYDEFYGHVMTRPQWERLVIDSEMMSRFRKTMFKRVIPNLKRIGLLSDRIKPKYAELGLLGFEHGKAAPELTAKDLLDDRD
ncbi:MAG: ferritin-like domain-containing protein [Myxococcaceae bacterium]|nr:ferritin-like domain-containing protein [Myxococcaceae bacterium]